MSLPRAGHSGPTAATVPYSNRTGREWKAGITVAAIDIGKGVLATLLVSKIRIDTITLDHQLVQIVAGTAAVIGHIWTVLAKFKGGKGVATAAGVLLALYPWAGLICMAVFFTLVLTTRYVSVGSIAAASTLPLFLMTWKEKLSSIAAFLICAIVSRITECIKTSLARTFQTEIM